MKNLTPPKWAPYAVATEQGWVHPKTGEILISLRGLKSRIEKEQPSVVLEIETPAECPVENSFVEITTEESPEVIENAFVQIITEPSYEGSVATLEPVSEETKVVEAVPEKRGRGRPKKIQNGS
jgi:hypothetical protein